MTSRSRWFTATLAALSLTNLCMPAPSLGNSFTRKLIGAAHSEQGTPHIRDKWALLIGVDQFQDPAVKPNKAAKKDVEALRQVLEEPGGGKFAAGHVAVITGKQATASGINQVLEEWLAKNALPDDIIFVYVSSVLNKGPKGEPIVFSYDTLGSESELSGIDLKELLAEIRRRTRSQYVVLALDASPAPGSSGIDAPALECPNVAVLSATNGHQRSLNNGVTGTSVFIHHLAEAFRLEGGQKTLDEMFEHIQHSVSDDAQRAFNTEQTPTLALAPGSQLGELVPGMPVRSSNGAAASFSIGHPVDRLAVDHPDIIPPHELTPGQMETIRAKAPAAPKAKAGSKSKSSTAAADEDDDEPRRDVDYGPYMAKMKRDIQKHWSPPPGLENRRVVATFTINRDGRITDDHIVESSGNESIDKTALDALHAASPLDPLPPGAPRSVDIKYKFDWSVKRN